MPGYLPGGSRRCTATYWDRRIGRTPGLLRGAQTVTGKADFGLRVAIAKVGNAPVNVVPYLVERSLESLVHLAARPDQLFDQSKMPKSQMGLVRRRPEIVLVHQ